MTLVLYMPVVHQGYLRFLEQYADQPIAVLANEVAQQFRPLQKDIRALKAEQIVEVLKALKLGSSVEVADGAVLRALNQANHHVVSPNEEPMFELAKQYFPNANVTFVDVFLRWDSAKTLSHQELDNHDHVSSNLQDKTYIELAQQQAAHSSDQWRQVGAVLVKDGQVLFAHHNHHLPDDYQPVYGGDPRGNFSKGQHIDLNTAQHAEAAIVAQAAKEGVSLAGADLYLNGDKTSFLC
jgi:dCMP deaminase